MSEQQEGVCSECWNREGDKAECAEHCPRLSAYQYGRPWKHIIPENPREVEMEQKEEVAIDAPIEVEEMEQPPDNTDLSPESMVRFFGVKKEPEEEVEITLEVRQVTKTKKCLICGREESDKVKIRRGLCIGICYDRWRQGKLTHPVIGSFVKMGQEELNEARHGKFKKCLIEGCEKTGNRRGLCEVPHYKAWSKKRILHPELGEFFAIRKQKTKMKVVEKSLKQEKQDLFAAVKRIEGMYNPQELHTVKEILDETAARIITIDLAKYDVLYNKLQAAAKSQFMPIAHTILSLISIGLQVVEQSTGKNCGGE